MKVALIPFYKNQLKNRIFSHEKSRDSVLFPYFNLKNKLAKRGVDINTIDITPSEKSDIVIFQL